MKACREHTRNEQADVGGVGVSAAPSGAEAMDGGGVGQGAYPMDLSTVGAWRVCVVA